MGITATVHIPFFPKSVRAHPIIAEEDALLPALLDASGRHEKLIFARPSDKHGRFAGLPASLVSEAHARAAFDVTLVKADGARSRWIKAPNESEPRIPRDADTVICVVSAQAIGQPLSDRIAHRVERIEAICGVRAGEPLGTEHVARLLASEEGGLHGVGQARVIPVINMVDDDERRGLATEAAERALAATERFDRVVLTLDAAGFRQWSRWSGADASALRSSPGRDGRATGARDLSPRMQEPEGAGQCPPGGGLRLGLYPPGYSMTLVGRMTMLAPLCSLA